MKNFVKTNIKKLLKGGVPMDVPLGMSFSETTDKDLFYSISHASVIGSQLNDRKLKLTLFDIYDFDQSYISKLTNSSRKQNMLNAAGAAAMKDGKLKPYFEIFEVEIDLTTLFNNEQLKNLGII
jgi:hypothetical protein